MSIRFVILLIIMSGDLSAQCKQPYAWIDWRTFTGREASGVLRVDNRMINVKATTNFYFDDVENIDEWIEIFRPFADFDGIKNSRMPRTTWDTGDGTTGEMKITFSEPVTNLVVLLSSLGGWSGDVTLTFSREYMSLYGNGGMMLIDRSRVQGREGHAILLFPGTFSEITIKADRPEFFNTINFGLRPNVTPIALSTPKLNCGVTSLIATGGVAFEWSGGQTPGRANNTFAQAGTYFIKATDRNGCVAYTQTDVAVQPVNHKSTTVEKTICPGETLAGYNTSGTHVDTLKTSIGCDSVRTLKLTVLEPTVSFTQNPSVCAGETVALSPVISNTSSPLAYTWSTGETSPMISVTQAGRYDVTVQNGLCFEKASVQVSALKLPKVLPDETVCLGKTISAGGLDVNLTYQWEHSAETIANIPVQQEGTYRVTVSNSAGCSVIRTVKVEGVCTAYVYVPNSFTPNSDGENDVFRPTIFQGNMLEITIYNRWGQLLYTERSPQPTWDGRSNGQMCSSGLYAYRLVYRTLRTDDLQTFQGSILLLR